MEVKGIPKIPELENSGEEQNESTSRFFTRQVISKERAYQGGILAGITIISIICAYVLWALLSTDSFLPYSGEAYVPQTVNILAFIVLVTLVSSGVITLSGTVGYVVYHFVRKKKILFNEKLVVTMYAASVLLLFVTLLLHVFKVINFLVSLLFFVAFWGIVAYVQVRKRSRFQKYIPQSDRRAKGSNPV